MKSSHQEYYVIFDTNVLYHAYDKRADFSSFCFNSTFDNVEGFINQLDIYEQVTLVIPSVVWHEMESQIVDAHQLKIKEFRERVSKHIFPEIEVKDNGDIRYADYIHPIIEDYRKGLSSDVNKVFELPLASAARYHSIVSRAFAKQPPFEGKDKKSDKGFKDAILWESILEFTSQHSTAKIIFYSKDNIFGEKLETEFSNAFPNASLLICTTENTIKESLEIWAKEIDIYSYTPIEKNPEPQDLIEWLQSADFSVQLIDHDWGLVENNHLVTGHSVELLSFENIQIANQTEGKIEYSIEAVLEVTYTLKNGTSMEDRMIVTILISRTNDDLFSIEDLYMAD